MPELLLILGGVAVLLFGLQRKADASVSSGDAPATWDNTGYSYIPRESTGGTAPSIGAPWGEYATYLGNRNDNAGGWDMLQPNQPSARRTSERGINLIAYHEGFRAEPYRDAAGHWTIGYGHLIKAGERFTRLSQAQALSLLRADVRAAESAVNELVKVGLDQGQFDALVSFTFNLGAGALRSSKLLRVLNYGDYAAAAQEFARWNKAGGRVLPGLVARRDDERELFVA